MIRLVFVFVFLVIAQSALCQTYQAKSLTADEAHADIALMRRALETIHPGLYRYRSQAEIDAAFARLADMADQPTSDVALWRAISLMLAEIHCDHTKAEAPDAIALYREREATHLPLRFKLLEGRMIVVSNDGQPGAPSRGAEITGINGKPVPVVLSTLARAVAYDGTTDQSIAAKLSTDSDLSGDDFNEYWPAFFGFPASWELEWKSPGELTSTHSSLRPITFEAWRALSWPGGPYRSEFYSAVKWRLSNKAAYLRIDTFVNYRNPVDATAFLGGFFKTAKAQHADNLILDLRENGGGSEDVSIALGRYLIPQRFTWSKPVLLKAIRYGDLPAHIESWGDRTALFEPPLENFRKTPDGWWERSAHSGDEDDESVLPQDPVADRFTGQVTILIGPRNGSGATRTIAQLKEKIGARLVGEDSSGSAEGPTAGHIFLLSLPNSGVKIRIPNAWNRTDIAHFILGRGVPVDEQVTPTLADFDQDIDRTLDVVKDASPARMSDFANGLSGRWEGTLDYRDYGNDRRVTLPTMLEATAQGRDGGGDVTLAFAFDDGPGKTVRSSERWIVDIASKTLVIEADGRRDVQAIIEQRSGPKPGDLTLVATGRGEENGAEIRVQTIVTRRDATLSIAALTAAPGSLFLLRHAYRFSQVK
jgi:hypothetical protein